METWVIVLIAGGSALNFYILFKFFDLVSDVNQIKKFIMTSKVNNRIGEIDFDADFNQEMCTIFYKVDRLIAQGKVKDAHEMLLGVRYDILEGMKVYAGTPIYPQLKEKLKDLDELLTQFEKDQD